MNLLYLHTIDSAVLILAFAFATSLAVGQDSDSKVSFDRDIRPLLSDRCYACHGPDSSTREADLRLDLQEESHGFAIEPNSPEESELWRRITSDDEAEVMPPPESHKSRFAKPELELIRKWIEQGARYERFWAFQKIEPAAGLRNRSDFYSKIDHWVTSRLRQQGMTASPQADLRTLVRRSSLDLTGLPPTPAQIREVIQWESDSGFDAAWENWIDHLIASNRYGEHMARYWLDVVRYADTNGMHKDFYRNHFVYRDWVIRAFNENLPYDKFLTYQLAGDLIQDATQDQLVASAFNRLHMIIDRGTALPEESFHKNVIDRVTAVSTAFLGLTMQCAQCHDHKYDPITQKEFYAFYGFFNNFDTQPETDYKPDNGLQPPFISLATQEQRQALAEFDERLKNLAAKIDEAENRGESLDDPSAEQMDELNRQIADFRDQMGSLKQERSTYNRLVPYAMVSKERETARPTFVLERGQYDSRGVEVQRGTPAFLPPIDSHNDQPSRLDLANWLTSSDHPLTARVAVNRIWQNLIGRGIVNTSEDFGAQGSVPTHPELLDHLAWSFIETGWDTKRLVKSIVMSKTYRQSSKVSGNHIEKDPDNRWLSRSARFRLDAEIIRDQLLYTSGNLVERMYGPSVKPPQPGGLWESVTMTGERFVADQGEDARRRSIYTYWKRAMPPPQMTILNAPMRDSCVARRERTNTPSQALLLLNEPAYFKAGRKLAIQTLMEKPGQRIPFVWETITGKLADQSETQFIESLLEELNSHYKAQPELAAEACEGIQLGSMTDADVAAWTAVVNTIYNLDITRARD